MLSSSNLTILPKIPTSSLSPFTSLLNLKLRPLPPLASRIDQTREESLTTLSVEFATLKGCKLGISRYPDFDYNAEGGYGSSIGHRSGEDISVFFDPETLYIPPLTGATTKFLGLPLPPLLKIDIVPEVFKGTINRESGKVELRFRAKFWFSVGRIYRAPPLMVETTLTSEESKGTMRDGRGERIDGDGRCKLVGVATVDPIGDTLMDSFLGLPTECIAALDARISISGSR